MKTCLASFLLSLGLAHVGDAFAPAPQHLAVSSPPSSFTSRQPQVIGASSSIISRSSKTSLKMGMDLVTYLRTEWISAALCSNQIPRSADNVLQLGTEDGRAITFIPRTVRELITSSSEPDGKLTLAARRQLKQQQQIKLAATVTYVDQAADDLTETATESVDVVISLMCAAVLKENGRDWKRSVREAARVLKPGGRLLFCEPSALDGDSYLEYVQTLLATSDELAVAEPDNESEEEESRLPVFAEVGFDNVDLVLVPHIAGVAVKSEDAGLTPSARAQKYNTQEKERKADLSLEAYERGNKKRRRKKKSKEESAAPSS